MLKVNLLERRLSSTGCNAHASCLSAVISYCETYNVTRVRMQMLRSYSIRNRNAVNKILVSLSFACYSVMLLCKLSDFSKF